METVYCERKTKVNSKPLAFNQKPKLYCSKTSDASKHSEQCEKKI